MNLSFYIRETPQGNFVYVSIVLNKKRTRLSTGIKVNKNAKIIKGQITKREYHHQEKNNKLNLLESNLKLYYNDCIANRKPPTLEEIKNRAKLILGKHDTVDLDIDFWGAYNTFIEKRETGEELTQKGSKYSHSSIESYKAVKSNLMKFEKTSGQKCTFNNINESFLNGYKAWLIKNNMSKNTISMHIKSFKTFLRWCNNLGMGDIVAVPKVKAPNEDTDAVYVTKDELDILLNTSYSNPKHEFIRDLFVLHCNLGLRVMDFLKLSPENIDLTNRLINTVIRKSGKVEKLTIPLSKTAVSIIEKYNKRLPKISKKNYNLEMKTVCKIAGIDRTTEKNITRGGKRVTEVGPKYQFISSHTARRSFITIGLGLGLQPEIIMKITGHSDHKTMQKYVRFTKKDVIDKFNSVWD